MPYAYIFGRHLSDDLFRCQAFDYAKTKYFKQEASEYLLPLLTQY